MRFKSAGEAATTMTGLNNVHVSQEFIEGRVLHPRMD
jgi:hypothetical protein